MRRTNLATVTRGSLLVGRGVVEEDVGQLGDILEEGIDGAGGELGKGRVRGGKEGKLVGAGEGRVKLGSGQGGSEGIVGARALDRVQDILASLSVLGRGGHDVHVEDSASRDAGHGDKTHGLWMRWKDRMQRKGVRSVLKKN